MGKVTEQEVRCGNCNDVAVILNPDMPPQCRSCGSAARHFSLTISETFTAHSSIGLKAKRGGSGKPVFELKSGDSFSRKANAWYQREMVVDREKNLYQETVTNPETGEIVHACEEPLNQHQGHGSAKGKA